MKSTAMMVRALRASSVLSDAWLRGAQKYMQAARETESGQ